MPVYEYVCTVCAHPIEVMHSFTAEGPTVCTQCGGAMRKALSTPAIVFKGSGWAKKDHRDKVHASSKSSAATAAADAGTGTPPSTDGASTSTSATTSDSGGSSGATPESPVTATPAAAPATPAPAKASTTGPG
ncbi:MAG: FmdB family transcriptional regulator [Chloroflexi bacterium]|nr:FmdB family transcriptional regulator [Chloroflexota bacterium]